MTAAAQAVPETVTEAVSEAVPGTRAPHADRHGHALAALRAVETRTGVTPDVVPDALLRPVAPGVAALLPQGALVAGSTVVVAGSTTLLLALLAAPSKAGAWTVFVGHPEVGLAAAADAGCELSRTVCVPDPGPDAPAVVAALLDGMDLVVVGPRTALHDADRRRLTARARDRGAILIAAQERGVREHGPTTTPPAAWPGAQVVLTAARGTWNGVDHGAGHLCRRALEVRRTGRGQAARPATLRCTPVEAVTSPRIPLAGKSLPWQAQLRRQGGLEAR